MSEPSGADWSRVKALLAEALALAPDARPAFLESHCGAEPALRRELQSLIAMAEASDGFLASLDLDATKLMTSGDRGVDGQGVDDHGEDDSSTDDTTPVFEAGRELGSYRIEAKIGEGGMGAVYRACDTRLDRAVAIKTIVLGRTTSAQARARFEREMRLLASLDHPNVLRIYDIGEHQGLPFAVTELLQGRTLAEMLRRGALPVPRVVELVVQIARGLGAAHGKNIVHRDLKPENLFVSRDDTVKILDFGIAKLQSTYGKEGSEPAITQLGVPIGTPSYMSPEQALGEVCDHRTDFFSLGSIIFEMLVGRQAFPGTTWLEVQHAVAQKQPAPIRELCPELGENLARIVERCLEKDPVRRFQSADDLAFQLEGLDAVSTRSPTHAALPPRRKLPRKSLAVGFALAGLVMAAILTAAILTTKRPRPAEPPRLSFLSQSSRDWAPGASADGKWLSYLSDRDGVTRLWIEQRATGEERALAVGAGGPAFDASSDQILFTRRDEDGPALYSIGPLGQKPRRVMADAVFGAWSPDGRRLAFVREERGGVVNRWRLLIASTDGSTERSLHVATAPLAHLRWSSDGRHLFAVVGSSAQGRGDELLRVAIESGEATPIALATPPGRLSRPVLIDNDDVLLVAHSASLTGYLASSRVLRHDLRNGRSRTLFWMPAIVRTLERADGDIVFDAITRAQELHEVSQGSRVETPSGWLGRGRSVDRQPVYSAASGDIIFSSNRSGNVDIWQWSARDKNLRSLAPHPGDDWDPAVAPDGALLWSSNRDGALEIYISDPNGQRPRPLTVDRAPAENPSVSRDGWVVYSSGHPDHKGLRRIRLDGSNDQPISVSADLGRAHPDVSPSGRWVVLHDHLINGVTTVFTVDTQSGAPTCFRAEIRVERPADELPITLGRARWRPDEGAVAYLGLDPAGRVAILERAFDAACAAAPAERTLFVADPDHTPESFAYAPDGERLVVSFLTRRSSILVAHDAAR